MSTDGIYFQVFREITSGKVELPGLPDVAMKVRQAISDENNDINTVVRIIQTDPGLSAHLLLRANSPLHRTRVPAENLANAVRCFGLDGTCNMVTSYILQNMFLSRSKVVRTLLAEVWRQSVKVASISAVLASKCRGFDPDSAMLAGLLHDIGSLPLLNRLGRHTRAKLDENEARKVLDDLSPQVGTVMLRQWEFDERFVEVVRRRNAWDHDPAAAVDLADLVQVARLHSYIGTPLMANFPRIDEVTAFAKLPLVNCRRR